MLRTITKVNPVRPPGTLENRRGRRRKSRSRAGMIKGTKARPDDFWWGHNQTGANLKHQVKSKAFPRQRR